MNKDFIPYKQALELKELGFDEPCLDCYSIKGFLWGMRLLKQSEIENTCTAPLYQQAFRWFREKYGLFASFVEYTNDILPEIYYMFTISGGDHYEDFNTYEEAELACIIKLIEIAKNK